ncbi:DNA-binding MarR family transcriptional regulator [Desulfobotulus alkaliphilus]|uniref:DNA-binding MarR family transcriptional regulator n=1 Tax=Desulfobotulus alkaliphilus TaxID=622671 RepID=A0A562RNR2_9BACT|nr:MarR family winged helix-turn-helix transcriptional regulator [Desulfobotulus alkaliphilus]TWI70708.1 DNA-binding MarR family transcriptional regulator [Desulfobotulus alkaliphilus]
MDDKRLFYLIHRVHGKLSHAVDQFLWDRLQITSAQLMALFYIRDHDGCLLKDLGEGIQLKSSGITGLVRRMEKNGLIRRTTCPHDGRGFRLYISPEGERIASGAMPMVAALNGIIREGFSVEEMDTVFRFLNTLLERLSGSLSFHPGQEGQDNGGRDPAV